MSEELYTVTMNRKQLAAMRRALEACFRMGIGQPGEALEYCKDKAGAQVADDWDTIREVESIIKPKMGLHPNASWGVGRFEDLDLLCEMYKVIEHYLSWTRAVKEGLVKSMESPRDWKTMMGVNFDEPMKYTQEPFIKVEKVPS